MKKLKYMVGTMIEIPRAALTAGEVAKEAEFFSFGTNDLTQTTMGLSRDDYTKFQQDYQDKKIFADDPFAVLDQEGVGQLVKMAVEAGRKTRPEPGSRHLRRARRRAELGAVLLPRGHGLRVLLSVPRSDRPPGRRASRDQRRQERNVADRIVAQSNLQYRAGAQAPALSLWSGLLGCNDPIHGGILGVASL